MNKLIILASAGFLLFAVQVKADFMQENSNATKDTKLMRDDSVIKKDDSTNVDKVMRDDIRVGPTNEVLPQPVAETNDTSIEMGVKDAFIKDSMLSRNSGNVNIKSDKGVVTLSGSVDSEKAKADMEAKAKDVKGVVKIINDLKVQSSQTTQ